MSQVNASQNSRQILSNTHNNFQPLTYIITEILIKSILKKRTIISGERLKKRQKNITEELLIRLQRDNQSKEEMQKRIQLNWNTTFIRQFLKKG